MVRSQVRLISMSPEMLMGFSWRWRSISHSGREGNSILGKLTLRRSTNGVNRIAIRSTKVFASVHRKPENIRVFVLSDLHTDYEENMTWVKHLSTSSYLEDILLVAGDVAEAYDKFLLTMSLLKKRFKRVFYVPGNHDLWCRVESEHFVDSLDKLNALLDACGELGVESNPTIVGDLGIIPLLSWYHESFDKEPDLTGLRVPSLKIACKDFHVCKWSPQLCDRDESLARYFDAMNDKHADIIEEIQTKCRNVISFSHFVPRQDLCPEKRMLLYPHLPKIIGSDFLETRLRSIHGATGSDTSCHVFGHTHFGWDALLDGIRYTQAPLAYPKERKRRMNGGDDGLPFCIFSDGNFTERWHFYWSYYYSVNPRKPENQQLAPWVAKFYRKQVS